MSPGVERAGPGRGGEDGTSAPSRGAEYPKCAFPPVCTSRRRMLCASCLGSRGGEALFRLAPFSTC